MKRWDCTYVWSARGRHVTPRVRRWPSRPANPPTGEDVMDKLRGERQVSGWKPIETVSNRPSTHQLEPGQVHRFKHFGLRSLRMPTGRPAVPRANCLRASSLGRCKPSDFFRRSSPMRASGSPDRSRKNWLPARKPARRVWTMLKRPMTGLSGQATSSSRSSVTRPAPAGPFCRFSELVSCMFVSTVSRVPFGTGGAWPSTHGLNRHRLIVNRRLTFVVDASPVCCR